MPNSEGRVVNHEAGEQATKPESLDRDRKDSVVKRSSELPRTDMVCMENKAGVVVGGGVCRQGRDG